jgi:hypothetical protein
MILSRNGEVVVNIAVGGRRLEQVGNTEWLGSIIPDYRYNLVDVKLELHLQRRLLTRGKERVERFGRD